VKLGDLTGWLHARKPIAQILAVLQQYAEQALADVRDILASDNASVWEIGIFLRFSKVAASSWLANAAEGGAFHVGDTAMYIEMPVIEPVGFPAGWMAHYPKSGDARDVLQHELVDQRSARRISSATTGAWSLAAAEVIVDSDAVPTPRGPRAAVFAAAWVAAVAIALLAASGGAACVPPYSDPEVGTLEGSPLDDLPPHISIVVPFGQRPAWSRDGRALVFLDRANDGNAWTVDVATGATRNLTGGFTNHQGFSRAHLLGNGDILLCGPTSGPRPTPRRPEAGRFNGVLWVLRAPFREPPQPSGWRAGKGWRSRSAPTRSPGPARRSTSALPTSSARSGSESPRSGPGG